MEETSCLKNREANVAERMMDNWAIFRLIDWAAGKNGDKKTKTSLQEELCDLADELAGPSPSSRSMLAEPRRPLGSPSGCMKPSTQAV